MEKYTDKEIYLTNNEVKDILGTPPKWILRWGNLLLLLIMVIIITGTIFVRHPETIEGSIEIVPVKKMLNVSVPVGATIDTVLVKDGALVDQGDSLLKYSRANNVYSLVAPAMGRISIEQLLYKGALIGRDSLVINIDPSGQEYIVKGIFPGRSITKIYPGQSIGIDLDNYPKEDFGSLTATVITKPVPDSLGNALILIKLNNNNTTNYDKTLPISTLARGTGYTVISNRRLIRWLLSK
ncbi:MAG TPA: hypothetical protein VK559_11315 [Ferruginibacter sp.]|nr:hypothetical protein [Ferruginibacter sp.]